MPDQKGLLSQFYFTLDGAEPPPQLVGDLLSVTVDLSLHMPDVATLTFHDPRLRWIDAEVLAPGRALVVSAKADRDARPLFDGEIVEIEPEFDPSTHRLVVRAFDRLHRLSRGRAVRSFQNMTDGELVQKIAKEVGLQAKVGPTPQSHQYILQPNQSNLAFLQERAAALGYLLYVRGKTLHCDAPRPEGGAVALRWGESLSEFRPRLSTIGQVSSVTARGWNPDTRQEIEREVERGQGAPQVKSQRSGAEAAQQAFHMTTRQLVADRPIRSHAAALQLAQAAADRNAQRFIEAEGVCGGNPAIVAGASLQLSAVGERFGGEYFVTGATHIYNADEGYTTQFHVSGLHPSTLISLLRPEAHSAEAQHLALAIVTDNQDPEGLGRVKVRYPWLSSEHTSDWARVVVVGGGSARGIQFLPEIDDEVLVGFDLGDIHYPVVLGGLWNGIDKPPEPSDEAVQQSKVQRRLIRSRVGHTILIDDADEGGITIQDRDGNRIALTNTDNKLTIEVKGNALVHSEGDLAIKADGSIQLEASGEMTLKGSTIDLNPM